MPRDAPDQKARRGLLRTPAGGRFASARFTRIPARLDRLPWTRFHWHVVAGLGAVIDLVLSLRQRIAGGAARVLSGRWVLRECGQLRELPSEGECVVFIEAERAGELVRDLEAVGLECAS